MSHESTKFLGPNEQNLNLSIQDGVFGPTATTSFLIDSVAEYIETPGKLLDLGSIIASESICRRTSSEFLQLRTVSKSELSIGRRFKSLSESIF